MSDQDNKSVNSEDLSHDRNFERKDDLELDENYFGHQHADVLNMESVEEIEHAIEKCKENILLIQETSEEKRLLVQRLVRLRLRHQELLEINIYMDPKKKIIIVQHHKFACQSVLQLQLNSSQIFCETCSGLIWIPVQNCFVCSGNSLYFIVFGSFWCSNSLIRFFIRLHYTDCEYVSHGQCLNKIRRICALVKITEKPIYVKDICPERTLDSQNFRCAECKATISFGN